MRIRQRTKRRLKKWVYICPECGQPGNHFCEWPHPMNAGYQGETETGFWTCKKFYDPKTSKRLKA